MGRAGEDLQEESMGKTVRARKGRLGYGRQLGNLIGEEGCGWQGEVESPGVSWMRRKAWVRVSGPKGHGRRLRFEVEERVEWL